MVDIFKTYLEARKELYVKEVDDSLMEKFEVVNQFYDGLISKVRATPIEKGIAEGKGGSIINRNPYFEIAKERAITYLQELQLAALQSVDTDMLNKEYSRTSYTSAQEWHKSQAEEYKGLPFPEIKEGLTHLDGLIKDIDSRVVMVW